MQRNFWRALLLIVALGGAAWAEERKGDYEVHDLSMWVVEPTLPMANLRTSYPSAFPAVVTSTRGPQMGDAARRIAPFGMITFHGKPAADLDVDLRSTGGNFLAHWPAGESLPNRLRWTGNPSLDLVDKIEDESDFAFVDEDHWFRKARQGEALFVRRGARAERFLAYDAELGLKVPLQVLGGPDKYTLVYTAEYTSGAPLHDVLVARSTPQGVRVAWIDKLTRSETANPAKGTTNLFGSAGPAKPADGGTKAAEGEAKKETSSNDKPAAKPATGAKSLPGLFGDKGKAKTPVDPFEPEPAKAPAKPAEVKNPAAAAPPAGFEVTLSDPLPTGSPAAAALTTKALSDRLLRAGLSANEVELFVAHYERAIFESDALVVLCRLDPSVIEEKIRLSIFPDPAKTVRVAMVLMRNVDPQFGNEIQKLVSELGDPKFAVREKAQARLTELGPLAFASLHMALTSSDLEVVLRAERILLNQNQSLTAQPKAAASAGVVVPAAVKAGFRAN